MVGTAAPPADRPLHPQNSGNGCLALVALVLVDLVGIGGWAPSQPLTRCSRSQEPESRPEQSVDA